MNKVVLEVNLRRVEGCAGGDDHVEGHLGTAVRGGE